MKIKEIRIKNGDIQNPLTANRYPGAEQSQVGTPQLPEVSPVSLNSEDKIFPVSLTQLDTLNGTKGNNYKGTMSFVYSLAGPLNILALKKSFAKIINRHWILRTKFIINNSHDICQVIESPETDFYFEKDFRKIPASELEETVQLELDNICGIELIDITKPPLIRVSLLRVDDNEYFIVLQFHHLIFDGPSLVIVKNELKEFYRAEISDHIPKIPKLLIQYADYAAWERKYDRNINIAARMDYWKKALRGARAVDLSTHLPRLGIGVVTEKRSILAETGAIDESLTNSIKDFCRKYRCFPFHCLALATSITLHNLSGIDDFVFYVGMSSRPAECVDLVGYFTTALPIRINFKTGKSFEEILRQIKDRMLEMMVNQLSLSQFEEVQLNIPEKSAIDPNIAFTLNFSPGTKDDLNLEGIEGEFIETEYFNSPGAGILFQVSTTNDTMPYYFSYDPKYFKQEEIVKISNEFLKTLSQLTH